MASGSSAHRAGQRDRALSAIARWHAEFRRERRFEALGRDPLQFARRYEDPRDREVVAMVSALLAFGKVIIITRKLDALLARLGPSPSRTVRESAREALVARLESFRHRTFAGADIARLLFAAGALQARDGGLYVSLERSFERDGDLRAALSTWVGELRALAWPEGMSRASRHLLPDPEGPSASKRVWLLMRWVVRPDDGVDLGLARIPASALVIPVDVHVHRIARNLGLTARADASRRTADEITDALRALSPDDPVQYDMAVCHLGIAQRCPSRRDPVRCEGCALVDVCVHWVGVNALGRRARSKRS
jgi:uncharacterized protein (TIGR02757 family)